MLFYFLRVYLGTIYYLGGRGRGKGKGGREGRERRGGNEGESDWVCTAVMSNDVMKDLRG